MGKKNRLREEKRRKAEHAVAAILENHSRSAATSATIEHYSDFQAEHRSRIDRHRGDMIRLPGDWRCRIKSRAYERRLIDFVRFAFARYTVPRHLENAWLEPVTDRLNRADGIDFARWYIVAAGGGSLYKAIARQHLSKQETHFFLAAPAAIATPRQAIWYAIARAQSADNAAALRVAQSRLVERPLNSLFWKDVARYFGRQTITIAAINDLVDYIAAARTEQPDFSLKGRSLAALTRRMEEWHRALRKQRALCGGAWEGHPIPDVDYETGSDERRAIWRFRQIKTGNDLFKEGQRMHHCVVSYKAACLAGLTSIWSLTNEFPIGRRNRGVTIELRHNGTIVQCRGFANRLPYPNEAAMAKRWAKDYGLTWRAYEG